MTSNETHSLQEFLPRVKESLIDTVSNVINSGNFEALKGEDLIHSTLFNHGLDYTQEEFKDLNLWFDNLWDLAYWGPFCLQEGIEEIIIHSHEHIQTIGKERKAAYPRAQTKREFQKALEWLALKNHVEWNYSRPFASFKVKLFSNLFRATMIHKALCPSGVSKVFLRSMQNSTLALSDFNLSKGQNSFFQDLVQSHKNILICGATGSGKTTFTQAMVDLISPQEHLIVLEDTQELRPNHKSTTHLLASGPSENNAGKGLNDFCQYAMRMRPDRLVVGEVRGKEVVPLLLALNTGHRGFMSTLHANSAVDAISRLALLFQIYCEQKGISYSDVLALICRGVDFIVFMQNKQVKEVIEILGNEGPTPIYRSYE